MHNSELWYYLVLFLAIFLIKFVLYYSKDEANKKLKNKKDCCSYPSYLFLSLDYIWAMAGFVLFVLYYYQSVNVGLGGPIFLGFLCLSVVAALLEVIQKPGHQRFRLIANICVMLCCIASIVLFYINFPTERKFQVAVPYFDKSMSVLNNAFLTTRMQVYITTINASDEKQAKEFAVNELQKLDTIIFNRQVHGDAAKAFDIVTSKIVVSSGDFNTN